MDRVWGIYFNIISMHPRMLHLWQSAGRDGGASESRQLHWGPGSQITSDECHGNSTGFDWKYMENTSQSHGLSWDINEISHWNLAISRFWMDNFLGTP